MEKIKELLVKLRKKMLVTKIYIGRTMTYVGLVNSGMILFLFLVELKNRELISFDLDKYFVPLFVGGFFILFLVGWTEVKLLKGLQDEATQSFNLSPPFKEMKIKIDYIYTKLKLEEAKEDGAI